MTPHEQDDRANAPAGAAPQRRKERGAPTDGTVAAGRDERGPAEPNAEAPSSDPRHREEVVGEGSGETAGGSPATAAGEDAPAERSSSLDPTIAFDPKQLIRGGDLSNTPPQKTTWGGEDYLTLNFYLQYESFDSVRETLNRTQEEAKKGTGRNQIQLGDITGLVSPGGVRLGSGSKGLYAPWRIDTDHGVALIVCEREKPHKTQPSVQARATSLPLMRHGFATVLSLMRYLIEQLGATEVGNKLSRVDACIDLPGVAYERLGEPFEKDNYVSRAIVGRQDAASQPITEHAARKKRTSFSIGRSPLMLRVYDKLAEVRRDPVKFEVLAAMRWDGIPDCATRVEVEIARGRLKRFGIDTVEDWIKLRSDVLAYVVRDWFRLTEGAVDPKHANRARTHSEWRRVQGLFEECYGVPFGFPLSPLPPLAVDPSSYLSIAVGVLKTMFAVTGRRVTSNREFVQQAAQLIEASVIDRDMPREVAYRVVEKQVGGLELE